MASEITVGSITKDGAIASWSQVTPTANYLKYEIGITPTGATISPTEILSSEASPKLTLSGLSPGTEYTINVNTIDSNGAKGAVKSTKFTTLTGK